MSKNSRRKSFVSTDGEIHFVYEEHCLCDWVVGKNECDEFEARKVSKHEASKPLFITHE